MVQKAESDRLVPRPDAFLTATQSRILLSMFLLDRPLYTKEILDSVDIPQSTWSSIALAFSKAGLITKQQKREIDDGRVKFYTLFSLTERGKIVAKNLVEIYRKLSETEMGSLNVYEIEEETDSYSLKPVIESFDDKILDCIEKALDSFGQSTMDQVRIVVALAGNLNWSSVPKKPEVLSACLIDRFGPNGAATIESVITSELEKRFSVKLVSSLNDPRKSLNTIISDLRKAVLENAA